jgi:hypothetical protein
MPLGSVSSNSPKNDKAKYYENDKENNIKKDVG